MPVCAYDQTPYTGTCPRCGADNPAAAMPARLPAQLDIDGQAHDVQPAHERLKLFEPAPIQLAGQQHLNTDHEPEE